MTVFASVQINEQSFATAGSFLTQLPLELRTGVIPSALKAAAKPVVKKAESLAPDSVRSGSRSLWSKKVRQARASTVQHKDTIGSSTVRNYGKGTSAIYIGPLYPIGNLINVIGHPHQQVLWGRNTGQTIAPTKYLEQAAQATTAEQQSAFVSKVQSETASLLAKGAKP